MENNPEQISNNELTNGPKGITPEDILKEVDKVLKRGTLAGKETTGEDLLLSDIKEIPCLVEPFFQQTGIACLAGSSDTGKSSLLRQLAVSIVTGESHFLGFKINAKHRSVIYVSTEDLERETAYLLARQSKKYNARMLHNLRFVFDTTDLYNELDKRLTDKPADLVIADCFADAFGGDLKDTQQIRTYLHIYQELAQKHNCLILLLHHTAKRTESLEPSKNNLLSGQGFEAKMRLVIELRADINNPNTRHFCIVKGNYLPASYKKESYVLQFDEHNFIFSNTGERMPFELLVKSTDDNGKAKYEQAKELKDAGKTYAEIAREMGYNSKGSVAHIFDKAKKHGWEKERKEDEDPF